MGQASQTPRTTDVGEAPPHTPTATTGCFALPTPRCHAPLASGVHGLACRRPHGGGPAGLRAGGLRKHRRLGSVVALTPGGPGRIAPQGRPGRPRRFPVRATSPRCHAGWGGARVVSCRRKARLAPGHTRGLAHRLGLLGVVAGIRPVTRHTALTRLIHTRWRLAAVLPALGVGRHAGPLGGRPVALRLVCGALVNRVGAVASPGLARAHPRRLGLGLPTAQGRLTACQALLPALACARPRVAPTAAQGRLVRRVLRLRLGHPGGAGCTPPLPCLLPLPLPQRLVPRRMARACRPRGRHVAPLHPPRCCRQAPHRPTPLLAGLERQRAASAAGAAVGPLCAHHGHAGQGAGARQGALAARQHPHAGGREPPAHHQGRITGGRPTGLPVLRRLATAHIQLRHPIKAEADQGACGQRVLRALRRLTVVLGLPGTRRVATGLAPRRAPSLWGQQGEETGQGILA